MNIVVSGSRVQVYGDEVQTFKQLPVGNYTIQFNPYQGFYLVKSQELEVKEEKIYGSTIRKVSKCLDSFSAVDRNFGIILSGQKGAGKSLFTRVLARSCIDRDLPVIKVNEANPGLSDFISSIEQECCVIFDEFDKTFFSREDEVGPQSQLLSLFDGMDNGKKLFIITCNSVSKLSTYLLDRPGRFHYHFTFGTPELQDIDEYLQDKLTPEVYAANRDRLLYYASIVDMTYDYLRAICFELNRGYSLDDTIADLNIAKNADEYFDFIATIRIDGVEHQFVSRGNDLNFRSGAEWDKQRLWSDNLTVRMLAHPEDLYFTDNKIQLHQENIIWDDHIWDGANDMNITNFEIVNVEIRKSSYRTNKMRLMI